MINQHQQDSTGKKNEDPAKAPAGIEHIIVIGASSGGLEAIKTIVQNLPPGFSTPVFIVWHMSPDIHGILPQVLNRLNNIYAAHAYDNEAIQPNRIYIAKPDHHLIIENNRMRVTRGPKENRFRPAVDPLFRSAAYTYGNRVIGIVLSGALDDGTAGLVTVKRYGGVTVVQDPGDAEVPSMPRNAMREVEVDYAVPAAEIANLLVSLALKKPNENTVVMNDEQIKKEIEIAAEENALQKGIFDYGKLTPYTCPECHGVLSQLKEGSLVRYRCHTGHAYSLDTLIQSITENIEDNLYNVLRSMDESIMLLNNIGDHLAEANQPKLAALYFQKAKEAEDRSQLVRKAIFKHEHLSKDVMQQKAEITIDDKNA